MGAISLIPLLMSVALLSRTALDMTREVNNQRKEEKRPDSYRSHSVVPAWGKKILEEPQETETDFSDHQVRKVVACLSGLSMICIFLTTR